MPPTSPHQGTVYISEMPPLIFSHQGFPPILILAHRETWQGWPWLGATAAVSPAPPPPPLRSDSATHPAPQRADQESVPALPGLSQTLRSLDLKRELG